jgi:hypothetical protein
MGKCRNMGAGLAGSTSRSFKANVNQIQFGDRLQGLPPMLGIRRPSEIYRSRAGGNAPGRFRLFCINQLGNVGFGNKGSQFASNGDGVRPCPSKYWPPRKGEEQSLTDPGIEETKLHEFEYINAEVSFHDLDKTQDPAAKAAAGTVFLNAVSGKTTSYYQGFTDNGEEFFVRASSEIIADIPGSQDDDLAILDFIGKDELGSTIFTEGTKGYAYEDYSIQIGKIHYVFKRISPLSNHILSYSRDIESSSYPPVEVINDSGVKLRVEIEPEAKRRVILISTS